MPRTLYLQHFRNVDEINPDKNFCKIYEELCNEIKQKKFPQIDVIFEKQDIKIIKIFAKKISVFKKIFVVGVGGSSLGGRALTSLRHQNKLEFLESIDPETIDQIISKIDAKNSFFIIISKSGETTETVCQTLIILDKLKFKNPSSQFLFITENKDSALTEIAKSISANVLYHPKNIGGRFSCFSLVALLPAILCGINIGKVRSGAKNILERFLATEKNNIISSSVVQLSLYNQGVKGNVMMPYLDKLKDFTNWYRQLFAESLGKSGFGFTPINSSGTIDQHSQLQLYLDGTKDKFFTFFITKNYGVDFFIRDIKQYKTLFGGKKLKKIIEVEQDTTIEILNKNKAPIRIFEMEKLDEEVLGGLMMQMFLETILIAKLKKINPLDQEAVEERKNMAKKYLLSL
jgi:glucose-6-phosphate isomerase